MDQLRPTGYRRRRSLPQPPRTQTSRPRGILKWPRRTTTMAPSNKLGTPLHIPSPSLFHFPLPSTPAAPYPTHRVRFEPEEDVYAWPEPIFIPTVTINCGVVGPDRSPFEYYTPRVHARRSGPHLVQPAYFWPSPLPFPRHPCIDSPQTPWTGIPASPAGWAHVIPSSPTSVLCPPLNNQQGSWFWDISEESPSAMLLAFDDLDRPIPLDGESLAFSPPMWQTEIYPSRTHRFWRWLDRWGPIRVSRTLGTGGIRVKDVLQAIYDHFQERITWEDFDSIVQHRHEMHNEISLEYWRRISDMARRGDDPEGEFRSGLRRIDLLGKDRCFQGMSMETSSGRIVYYLGHDPRLVL